MSEEGVAHLDPVWIRQALDDLIDNAVRATPERGHVTVSGRIEDGRVRIAIEDSGGGFGTSFLPRAFEPFTRDRERGEEFAGAGLGLAIVRAIAEAHDGAAVAENIEGGARVAVIMRDRKEAAGDEAPRPATRA